MSYEVTKPADLLSAYLSCDLAPDERAAVEHLLGEDVVAAEQLEELRELSVLLKDADRTVSQATIDALHRIVWQKIQEKQLKALVTVSLTGDMTPKESADVQAYLNANPAANVARRQAAEVSKLLNAGNTTANAALAEKLRVKLKSALPPSAMTPVAKADSAAVLRAASPSGRTERPSLRIFVKPENPWKKRLIATGSLAALLAIAVTAWVRWRNSQPAANPIVRQDPSTTIPNIIDVAPEQHGGSRDEKIAIPDRNDFIPPERQTPPKPEIAKDEEPKHQPPRPEGPAVEPRKDIVKEKTPLTPQNPNPQHPIAPPPQDTVNRDNKPLNPGTQEKINEIGPKSAVPPQDQNFVRTNPNVKAPSNNSSGLPTIINPGNNPGNVATSTENTQTVKPPVPPPESHLPPKGPDTSGLGTTAVEPPTTAHDGVGKVGAISGPNNKPAGIITITTAAGAASSPKQNDAVASGSRIVTDGNSLMSLVLPNGRLYIQAGTELTVNFGTSVTSIVLNSGEIYYSAAAGGTLTLTAGKAQVTRVTEGDLTLNAGRLVVLNNGAALTFGKITLANGDEGSAAADGSDAPRKDNPIQLTGNGLWRFVVKLDGDAIGTQKSRKHR